MSVLTYTLKNRNMFLYIGIPFFVSNSKHFGKKPSYLKIHCEISIRILCSQFFFKTSNFMYYEDFKYLVLKLKI